jgi:putative DNA primase/helicase
MTFSLKGISNMLSSGFNREIRGLKVDSIPEELKSLRQWVAWRGKPKENGKLDKIPIDPNTGGNASSSNPRTWGTFQEALDAISTFDLSGVGFVFSESDPYVGIDLDDCLNPENGCLEPWAGDIVQTLQSYCEVTPSGCGLHIIAKGEKPGDSCKKGDVEIYSHARYFTVTGNVLSTELSTIEERQEQIEAFYDRIFAKGRSCTALKNDHVPRILSDQEIIDILAKGDVREKFNKLWSGDFSDYQSQSEGDLALAGFLARYTRDSAQIDRLFRASGLIREKWDERHYSDGRTYGEEVIRKAIDSSSKKHRQGSGRDCNLPRINAENYNLPAITREA